MSRIPWTAQRCLGQIEFSGYVGVGMKCELRTNRFQGDMRARNRPMLWIVHYAVHGCENRCSSMKR